MQSENAAPLEQDCKQSIHSRESKIDISRGREQREIEVEIAQFYMIVTVREAAAKSCVAQK